MATWILTILPEGDGKMITPTRWTDALDWHNGPTRWADALDWRAGLSFFLFLSFLFVFLVFPVFFWRFSRFSCFFRSLWNWKTFICVRFGASGAPKALFLKRFGAAGTPIPLCLKRFGAAGTPKPLCLKGLEPLELWNLYFHMVWELQRPQTLQK